MKRKIVIVGAGRQGRNVLDVFHLDLTQNPVAGFLDDTKEPDAKIDGFPVLGALERMQDSGFVSAYRWIIAIGACQPRYEIAKRLDAMGAEFASAVHPTVLISRSARLGRGIYMGGYSRALSNCQIGDWCIVEGFASIGADVEIGLGCLVGPGCQTTGGSKAGDRTLLGAGSVLANDISVGDDCTIGANAAVVRDIPNDSKAYGVPARIID